MIKKKNKSIFKRILAFLGASLCAIACCFSMIDVNNKTNVYADSVDNTGFTFNSSYIYMPFSFYSKNASWVNGWSDDELYKLNSQGGSDCYVFFGAFKISFSIDNNLCLQSINITCKTIEDQAGVSSSLICDFYYNKVTSIPYTLYNRSDCILDNFYFDFFYDNYIDIPDDNGGYYRYPSISVPIGFTISRTYDINKKYYYTDISYFDKNTNYFKFRLFAFDSHRDLPIFEPCTYYFSDNLNLTDNQYYNQGYDNGLNDGYNSGLSEGYNSGYNKGYNVGQNVGYNNGYNKGVSESNDYTFLGLISACIDAPITYFTSLFNFELLGVNLSSFLTALFTICVIVTIVRLCLGR